MDAGFSTIDENNKPIKGFTPPGLWRQYPNEWLFAYTRPGSGSTFLLRCSLQDATGKMFIHASELDTEYAPKKDNIQLLGLLLPNYIDVEQCSGMSWEGAVQNEETMRGLFAQYISGPLWEAAETKPGYDENAAQSTGAKSILASCSEWLSGTSTKLRASLQEGLAPLWGDKTDVVLAGAVGVAVVASIAALYAMRR